MKRITKHITPATVLAFVALVFAITGGAFAATGGNSGGPSHATLTASAAKSKAKSKTKAGPRGPAGPKGATGATGAAGPAGATGPGGPTGPAGGTGPAGTNGSNGTNGESVTLAKASGSECKEGGSKLTVAGKGEHVCNGEKGAIHPGETLPPEASETGVWVASGANVRAASLCYPGPGSDQGEGEPVTGKNGNNGECKIETKNHELYSPETIAPVSALGSISFTIPLEKPLEEAKVHYLKKQEQIPGVCEGTFEEPTAAAGNLCVYAGTENATEGGVVFSNPGQGARGALKSGAVVLAVPTSEETTDLASGAWAVTAPAAP